MEDSERWAAQSRMTDPGRHAGAIAALPRDIGSLHAAIQGMLVHSSWVKEYGLDETRLGPGARTTVPVAERLDDILTRDPRPFATARPADRRSVGTCRDFALMLCAFLRCKGVPARARCGFAAYFREGWEDHWVCEYRDETAGTWRLADAQIDPMLQRRNRIGFDPADMPRRVFRAAGEAWRECRQGAADPAAFGHGEEAAGLWFVKVNVLRDHFVLNGREASGWDRWRAAPGPKRRVPDREMALLDDLAARPDQPLVEIAPDW